MNRHQRRRLDALRRHFAAADNPVPTDRSSLLRLAAALAKDDPTVVGLTLIMPDGDVSYVHAGMLRRGGVA